MDPHATLDGIDLFIIIVYYVLEFFSRKKFLDKFFQNFEIDSKIPLLALY
jgi:hypothetical protein